MKYKLADLKTYKTPKAEKIRDFEKLSQVEFELPTEVRTILYYHCGLVQASRRGREDHDARI